MECCLARGKPKSARDALLALSEGCASPPKRQRSFGKGIVVGVTGSSCSGKTTLATLLQTELRAAGKVVAIVAQDSHRCSSKNDRTFWQGRDRKSWEGPQFTAWRKLSDATLEARERCDIVIVDGYMLLDGPPELHAQLDGVLWVSSTQQQVVARRSGYPREAKYGERGWPTREAYAAHCVWPAHVAHEARVQHLLQRTSPPSAVLPADEPKAPRVQRALGIVKGWLGASSSSAAAVASAASSASSSSSSASDVPTPPLPTTTMAVPRALPSVAHTTFAPSLARDAKIVLVTHGSMNPVHRGHVAMMVRAKAGLEAAGYTVVAGVIAITKAVHIRRKEVEPMPDHRRLQLLELASEPFEWLTHCGGLGIKVHSTKAYAKALLPTARQHHGERVVIATVDGSDVFLRYNQPPVEPGELRVIAARATAARTDAFSSEEAETHRKLAKVAGCRQNVLVLPPDAAVGGASSTEVRRALAARDMPKLAEICGEAVAQALVRDVADVD